jgi:hypothetical protein
MQVLIELRLAPDKISSLCQVPEDSLGDLLPADYCPIEINSRNMQIKVPLLFSKVERLFEQDQLLVNSYHRQEIYELTLERLRLRGRVLPNGDAFEGEVVDSLPNGQGTYKYAEDNRICVGSWVNGQMQGDGEITWPNDKRLQGHFESNRPVGECRVTWEDGRVYQGRLSDDYELIGLGIFTLSDYTSLTQIFHSFRQTQLDSATEESSLTLRSIVDSEAVYIGHFLDGMKQGHGVVITPFGMYEGEWQQDLLHGHGTCIHYTDMQYYSGTWRVGKMHGFGISESYEGSWHYGDKHGIGQDNHYTGGFRSNRYEGYGVLVNAEGKYAGEFIDGHKHGYGVMCYTNGGRYEGNWHSDNFEGFGIFYATSGRTYSGYYEQGKCKTYGHYRIQNDLVYEGELKVGLPHGYGRVYCKDYGAVGIEAYYSYEGQWTNGKYDGYGRWVKPNTRHSVDRDEYIGNWSLNRKQGTGKYTWANGESYEGEWYDNERSGRGTMRYSSGVIYEGYWANDKRNSPGFYTRPDGSVLVGIWIDDMLLIKKQLKMRNGDFYEGEVLYEMRNGDFYEDEVLYEQLYGEGEMTYAATGAKYQGQWLNGQRHGVGNLKSPSGQCYPRNLARQDRGTCKSPNEEVYEGTWIYDLQNGLGSMVWSDGSKYEGQWVKGKITGYGKMTYVNGDVFSGDWMDAVKQGKGTYEFADGRVLSGSWQNDQAHGECIIRLPSRESYSGRWEDGELVGEVEYRWPDGRVYIGEYEGMQGSNFSQLKIGFETYLGMLRDAQPHGLGSLSYQDKTSNCSVHGSWHSSRLEGYAEKTLPQGEWYKGWWRDNKLHGQGTYGWRDGTVYSGHWEDNMRTGTGVMKLPDGSKYEGEWYEDRLLEIVERVHKRHWAALNLKQVDDRIYHSDDRPRREFVEELRSYQDYAKSFSPCFDDDSSWSDNSEDD